MGTARRMFDIDFLLIAFKAKREPFLPLAFEWRAPGFLRHAARHIIGEPFGGFGEKAHGGDIRLFEELAQRRMVRIFALVDPALWHLPGMGGHEVGRWKAPPADEDEPLPVEQHD